ncbi:AfsR/SARP family transcriptional regulator [Actinokineospora bangkokensis]|uniref:OmpR/PhoB-type domain-containing protein n=1 Tax=Actinokineospora bangkokensis TaxID=1193682 RepID=A0A1Q9LJF8_9PSEU|nr:BTAD domain-containing putative transcriptional regulator [Actinokineospora bangkokensis]OLR92182.1 hypothetical protein BJP25_22895 [Actinokineospora bangkokensis]
MAAPTGSTTRPEPAAGPVGPGAPGSVAVTALGGAPAVSLLGDVRVDAGTGPGSAGPPMRRALLAALALRRGPVDREELLWSLWGDDPPSSATRNVQTYVAALRRLLEPEPTAPRHLLTVGTGYELLLPDESVDVRRFERLRARGRDLLAAGDVEAGLAAYDAALGLWRGEPLAHVPGPFAADQRTLLLDWCVSAAEAWALPALERGPAAAVVDRVRAVSRVAPGRPPLTTLLLRALDADGRRAEALAEAASAPTAADPELAAVVDRLRRGVPLDAEVPAPVVAPPRPAVPAQLPHDVHSFVGREAETERLRARLRATGRAPRTVVLHGTGGVGKTALAVHFGHQVAADFPDGTLYVDLRGFAPEAEPLPAAEALGALLRSLGDGEELPSTLRELEAAYRTRVAGKRLLVLLDNAASAEQVRPMLPGSPEPFVVVTSRNTLAELVVRDGAVPLALGALDEAGALELLAGVVGADRVAAEPAAAAALTRVCGLLPLALRIFAEQAALRAGETLADLLAELTPREERLDLLSTSDAAEAVRVVMSWSYAVLTPELAELFRVAGAFPGPDLTAPPLAAVSGRPVAQVERGLRALADDHLLERHGPGRYRVHDLLRLYAVERLAAEVGPAGARELAVRLLDWYLATAIAADVRLSPFRGTRTPPPPAGPVRPLEFADYTAARDWGDAELANSLELIRLADRIDLPRHACELANTMVGYYYIRGHWREWIEALGIAISGAVRLGDDDVQRRARYNLAGAYLQTERFAECLEQCAAIDRLGEGDPRFELMLGNVRAASLLGLGRTEEAARLLSETLARDPERSPARAIPLANLGEAYTRLGELTRALACHEEALATRLSVGDLIGASTSLLGMGALHLRMDKPDRAVQALLDSRRYARDSGSPREEALANAALGDALLAAGQDELARDCFEQALTGFERLEDPRAQAMRARLGG